jgi:hypothetical protein
LGALLSCVFQASLSRQLDSLGLAPAVWANIEGQRSRLAAIETKDARVRQAVEESFVSGYRIYIVGSSRADNREFSERGGTDIE